MNRTHAQAPVVLALPDEVTGDIRTALGWVLGLVAVACVAKIIFVGARMAWDHHHTPGVESPVFAEFLAAVVGWILAAAAAGGIATALLGAASPAMNGPQKSGNLIQEIEQKNPPLEGQQTP